jgi:hypothetical protein
MRKENPLWGTPRIYGELLMLGIEVAQSTVARYMTTWQGPPSQGWKTFLRNHAAGIASLDLFVVRTMACAAIAQALSAAAIRAPTTSPETRVAFRIVFSAREL